MHRNAKLMHTEREVKNEEICTNCRHDHFGLKWWDILWLGISVRSTLSEHVLSKSKRYAYIILIRYTCSTYTIWQKTVKVTYPERLMTTTVPSHEVILLASIFVPDCNVHVASLLIIQVEVKLLSPLGVQRFGDCLSKQRDIHCLSMCLNCLYEIYTYHILYTQADTANKIKTVHKLSES